MKSKTSLPGSSYEELVKVVKGYSHIDEDTDQDGLVKLTGISKNIISKNNKFLTEVGIITSGNKKFSTYLGRKLAHALEHNQAEDVQKYWREAIQSNDIFSKLVTTVRTQSGMPSDKLITYILYASGQRTTVRNKTGANALVKILCIAGLLTETEGEITVASPSQESGNKNVTHSDKSETGASGAPSNNTSKTEVALPASDSTAKVPSAIQTAPSIAINIQLHLPETDNAEVYEKCFKALREQLISPEEN